ncbi:MAG TPA: OpcA/G6PD domain-containing protein, partial [Candidatus Eisenbacteria bacterium]|nr:OpcA/G6PD domain-containing protein [Candidatus Eisenbacteria bacterium]
SAPPAGAWLLAGWLASCLDWKPREFAPGSEAHIRLGAKARPVSIRFEREGDDARRAPYGPTHAIAGIRICSGAPAPLDLSVRHEGRSPTARVVTRAPRATEREVAFGYRDFAACVVGEMHRHEPNRAFEDAARVAEELIGLWPRV